MFAQGGGAVERICCLKGSPPPLPSRLVTAQHAPVFDKQDQFDKIASGLMPGEQIIAVYDCIGAGTGFMGVTTKRLVFQDNSFVGKKVAITSIPYSRITSVSVVSNKNWGGQVLLV